VLIKSNSDKYIEKKRVKEIKLIKKNYKEENGITKPTLSVC